MVIFMAILKLTFKNEQDLVYFFKKSGLYNSLKECKVEKCTTSEADENTLNTLLKSE